MVAFLVAYGVRRGTKETPYAYFVKFGQNTELSYPFKTAYTCINRNIFYAYPLTLSPFKPLNSFRANSLTIV